MEKKFKVPNNSTANLPPKEQFVNHPDFAKRIGEAMQGVVFPKDKIPDAFKSWLMDCLKRIPFSTLGMPLIFYRELITTHPENMTFGLLQKAADIVYNSKPTDHVGSLDAYADIIEAIATLKDDMSDITDPIRDKVCADLQAAESIKKITS